MRILIAHDFGLPQSLQSLGNLVLREACVKGYEARELRLPDSDIAVFLGAVFGDPALNWLDYEQTVSVRSLVFEYRPNVLIAPAVPEKVAATKKALRKICLNFVNAYTLHRAKDGELNLINVESGKRFRDKNARISSVMDFVETELLNNTRLSRSEITVRDSVFDVVAETEIELRRYADVLPNRRTEIFANPKSATAGALETLQNDEIIHEDKLWLKGWIDWSEKENSCLIAKVGTLEAVIKPDGFRADKYVVGEILNPVSFSSEIDLCGMFSQIEITFLIQDKQGVRLEWLQRDIWVSRSASAHSRTPLITGTARLEAGRVLCDVDCDGISLDRIVAWQDGYCVGRWSGAPALKCSDISFDIHPIGAGTGSGIIHLHLHLRNRGSVPWLSLSPLTGAPVVFDEAWTGAALIDDVIAIEIDGKAEEFPVSLYRDGRLAGVVTRPSTPRISLEGCNGAPLIEVIRQNGGRKVWRFWRHRPNAVDGEGLPAFVLPPALPPHTFSLCRVEHPKVLLIRQTNTPTDELYILAALEEIAKDSKFDLIIVNLKEDDTTHTDRDRLLETGTFVIVSRYLTRPWIESLGRHRTRLGAIFYIMDDDVTLAENDTSMPDRYRKRMVQVAHGEFQTLLHLCTRFLVTSKFLADRFASNKTDLISPPYIHRRTDMSHLDDLSEIRIEYHGTQVHHADLDSISAALVWLHGNYPQVRIRTYMGGFAPERLRGLKRVEIVPDIPWKDYKAAVAASPAHIALAPMLEVPYNKAKSFVKIMDIARLGAVGLYTKCAPFESVVTHGKNGFLLENDALQWRYAMAWLVENPQELRRMGFAAQSLALELGDIGRLRDYWQRQIFCPDKTVQIKTSEMKSDNVTSRTTVLSRRKSRQTSV